LFLLKVDDPCLPLATPLSRPANLLKFNYVSIIHSFVRSFISGKMAHNVEKHTKHRNIRITKIERSKFLWTTVRELQFY